MEIT
jgi:alpha-aminoadipic semialdehyde synthase